MKVKVHTYSCNNSLSYMFIIEIEIVDAFILQLSRVHLAECEIKF